MAISYLFLQFYLTWFCLIPLFYILEKANMKKSILYGLLYGVVCASVLFYWVIPVSIRYSGGFTFYSLIFYCIAVIYFATYFVFFGIGYRFFKISSKSLITTGVSVSGFFVLLELIKINLLPGLPWLQYNLAVTQVSNLWIIQWTSLGGLYIIIFFIVFFNYVLTQYLLTRKAILLKTAIGTIIVLLLGSFILSISREKPPYSNFNTVLLNENINAETRWNDSTGYYLADLFFKLNKDAIKYDPDLIVWSEAAIPWKFEPDDEFIPKVLSITYQSKADHLLGIFSSSLEDSQLVYNSAYLIKKDGSITGRHDKTVLLDLIEKPFNNILSTILPFINTNRYENILAGKSQNLILSGKAQIGVFICNESLSEDLYEKYISEGANLFILMSNDAWFENTPLKIHHFYITRMEAVIWGRDVIVNSNTGIVGVIRSNGEIEALPQSNSPRIFNCKAHLASNATLYSSIKNLIIPFYLVLTFLPIVLRRKQNETYK